MPVRRLFFALWPDPAEQAALGHATRRAVRRAGGKPVPLRNYHVTLAFLGPVAPEGLVQVMAAGAAVEVPALTLRLERFGYWSDGRVFWIGPGAPVAPLTQLVARLRRALEATGLPPDHKAFIPHVTLARKVAKPPAPVAPVSVDWRVDRIALVASTPAVGHSRYEILQIFSPGSSPEP